MSELSVLFIPFEASPGEQHMKRNARNGVTGHVWQQQSEGFEAMEEVGIKGSGSFMSNESIFDNLPAIVFKQIELSMKDIPRPMVDSGFEHIAEERFFNKYSPDLIFLSEQPRVKEEGELVAFPGRIGITSEVQYVRLDNWAGEKSVQIIAAYRKESCSGTFHCQELNVKSGGGKDQHLLHVRFQAPLSGVVNLVGVHLSAENTKLTGQKAQDEINRLTNALSLNGIQFAMGDFNIDMSAVGGHIGALPGSTQINGGLGMVPELQFWTQQSSSNNKARYMGMLIIESSVELGGIGVERMQGYSLERSLFLGNKQQYFSDHPALSARLVFA